MSADASAISIESRASSGLTHEVDAKPEDEFFSDDRTAGRDEAIELPDGGYEDFLFDVSDPLLARYRGMRWDDYAVDRTAPDFVQDLLGSWENLYQEPFYGVTVDGSRIHALYALTGQSEASPGPRLAAERFLDALTTDETAALRYPIDAREWRSWSNPEFAIHVVGLRLEDLSDSSVHAFLELMRACLSPAGYELVHEVMELNGILGEMVDLPTVMNSRSYSVAVFGDPDDHGAWGWQIFGHHLAINFVSVDGRHVVAPVFLGAEPAVAIDGRAPLFSGQVSTAIELASSLTSEQRSAAVVYKSVLDPSMPSDRLHPADERHVAGAFQDNRVIPYEGLRAVALDDAQWQSLRRIIDGFLVLLTDPQREATLLDIEAYRNETHFAWYGSTDGTQPFYLRIQSPVILAELDHHAGVWLTNQLPARFHIHTTLRLPNGNDYARRYITQLRARHGETIADERWVN